MGKLGETKLARLTVEEMKKLITDPVEKKDNEISFGEFMRAYNPSMESHNFTYPIPDHHNFLNLQIYNVMMQQPFVVLKLEHPLFYRNGLTLEFHFGLGKGGRTTQCSSDFLYDGIRELERELYERWEPYSLGSYIIRNDKLRKCLEEKEIFRKEYFPQPILDAIEKNREYQKSLDDKNR